MPDPALTNNTRGEILEACAVEDVLAGSQICER